MRDLATQTDRESQLVLALVSLGSVQLASISPNSRRPPMFQNTLMV